MKGLAKILSVVSIGALVAGCASDVAYVPKIPAEVQAKLLDYHAQPGNKVFVLAVDPGGDYAYGYDYGKATLKDAAKVAVEKVDAQREASGIVGRPYVYALNDRVVWSEMVRAAQKGSVEDEREAQREVAEDMKDDVEVDAPIAE